MGSQQAGRRKSQKGMVQSHRGGEGNREEIFQLGGEKNHPPGVGAVVTPTAFMGSFFLIIISNQPLLRKLPWNKITRRYRVSARASHYLAKLRMNIAILRVTRGTRYLNEALHRGSTLVVLVDDTPR